MPISDFLQRILGTPEARNAPATSQDVELAAAVLLVEIARADFDLDPRELAVVKSSLTEQFHVSEEDARELLERAQDAHADSISLEPYISILNAQSNMPKKLQLLEALWMVAYADGVLDKYEEHMMRRVSDLLFIPHPEYIRTKLKVTGE